MLESVLSPHRIELLVRWLREQVEHHEGEKWREWLGDRARNYLWLPGKRGFWGYRSEANGEHRFSVSDGLLSPKVSNDEWWWWIFHRDAVLGGSLIMSPARDNSTDITPGDCTDQWRPYFEMLLEEMERPSLTRAVGAEESEEATEQEWRLGAPRLEERDDWPAKLKKLEEWEQRVARMPRATAADLIGISLSTLRGWQKRRNSLAR